MVMKLSSRSGFADTYLYAQSKSGFFVLQVAALLSALFRSTDLVPSDVLAGCVLLRVKQKRETREMRRIYMLADDEPKYSTGKLKQIFPLPLS